jgi:integrase
MPKICLTSKVIKSTKCHQGESKINLFDEKCKGLLLEVRCTGRKTYYLRYQDERSKTRQYRIADARDISLSQVRRLANKHRNNIALGLDPAARREELKKIPKLCSFIDDSYLPYIKTYKRSWKTDLSLIKNHVLPNFGDFYMDEITKSVVIQFLSRHIETHKPGSVNRVIILMRYIYNLALRWETQGLSKNPIDGIQLFEENNKKERYLTANEVNALITAIQDSDNKMLKYIIPMLLLTGARKQEVLKARWEDFNFEQRIWRIPMSKSGKARHVPISDGLKLVLNSVLKIDELPWVFINPRTSKPFTNFFYSWDTVRKSVGLSDVRIHDLRHSFASFLVNNGRSLYEVQRILGHTNIKTTQRYAHLSNESLLAAANEVTKAIPLIVQVNGGLA